MIDKNFYNIRENVTLSDIVEVTDSTLEQKKYKNEVIMSIASMDSATDKDICFFYDRKSKEKASEMKAKACITTEALKQFVPENVIVLINENPKIAFIKLNEYMYSEKRPSAGIDASAKISETAKIGKNCFIGANVVIGDEVEIGDNCFIGANVVIEHNCKIGNNCRIGNNASIAYTVMGNSCYIYTGARLGYDGFGFEFMNGQHHRIPQLGRLIIGDDVEIGANTCIDRGALDDTIIGTGSRIDNLVQIAHNDKLGRGCIIVSQVGIAGSCTLGDYVILGGQVGLADHLNIGTGAQIAAQSGVMRDVEAGAVVMGTPCVPFKDYMRQVSFLQKNSKK